MSTGQKYSHLIHSHISAGDLTFQFLEKLALESGVSKSMKPWLDVLLLAGGQGFTEEWDKTVLHTERKANLLQKSQAINTFERLDVSSVHVVTRTSGCWLQREFSRELAQCS